MYTPKFANISLVCCSVEGMMTSWYFWCDPLPFFGQMRPETFSWIFSSTSCSPPLRSIVNEWNFRKSLLIKCWRGGSSPLKEFYEFTHVGGNLGISWGWGVFGGGGLALLSVHDADHGRSAPDKEMQICRQIIGADQRRSLRVHHIWWNNETLNRKMIALGEPPSEKKSALELVKVLVTTPHIWKS